MDSDTSKMIYLLQTERFLNRRHEQEGSRKMANKTNKRKQHWSEFHEDEQYNSVPMFEQHFGMTEGVYIKQANKYYNNVEDEEEQ